MSKSLGNGIDPLDEVETYGADALRFTLIDGVTKGNDLRYSSDKVKKHQILQIKYGMQLNTLYIMRTLI